MKIANIVIVVVIGIAIMYDVFMFGMGGSGVTISYEFWKAAKKYPVVPFALGFLCGHLVWQYSVDTLVSKKSTS